MHYSPIASGLIQMNGDLEKFNETMTTGYKVADGYNLQMQSMTNQLEKAKNNLFALNAVAFDSIKSGFLPLVKLFNTASDKLSEIKDILPFISAGLASIFTTLTAVASSAVLGNIWNFMITFGNAHPLVRAISVTAGILVGASALINSIDANTAKKIGDINTRLNDINKTKQEILGLGLELNVLNKEFDDLGKSSKTNALDAQREVWERYSKAVGSTSDTMTDLIKKLNEISNIDPMKNINQADILKKNISRLETAKDQAQTDMFRYGNVEPSGFWNNVLKPFTIAETDIIKKYFDPNLGKITSTHSLESQYPDIYKKLLENSKNQIGGVTGKDYGKVLKSVLEKNISSGEYSAYVSQQEAVVALGTKIEKEKVELVKVQMENLGKEQALLIDSKNLAEQKLIDLKVKDMTNAKNFGEWKTLFEQVTLQSLPTFINKKELTPESTNIDFLKSGEATGYINDMVNARQMIKELEDRIKNRKGELSAPQTEQSRKAINENIAKSTEDIELWNLLIEKTKLALSNLADTSINKFNKSLVDIDFKTIKSNVEELTNELKSLSMNGFDLATMKMENLTKNYESNKSELITSLKNVGGTGDVNFDKTYFTNEVKSIQFDESGKQRARNTFSETEKQRYDDAIKGLTAINALEELGIKLNIDKTKQQREINNEIYKEWKTKASIDEQLKAIKNIGKEKTLQDELDSISLEREDIKLQSTLKLMSPLEEKVALGALDIKQAQTKYNWQIKENQAKFDGIKSDKEMLTYGYSLSAEQEYQNELYLIQQQQSLGLLTTEQQKTAKKRAQNDLTKKQIELTKQQLSSTASMINSFTTGSAMTPSYNLDNTFGKMANSLKRGGGYFGKANLNPKDYGQIFNFALTQASNIWNTINNKQIETINHQVSMLEIQKQLATTDEERQKIDQQILDKKIQAINLEMQSKQQQSISGGVTGAITTVSNNPNPLGFVSAGIQLISGLFGSNSAKEQAKTQKEQLKAQQKANEILERQTKLLEQQKKFYDIWKNNLFSGTSYGLTKAVTTSPINPYANNPLELSIDFDKYRKYYPYGQADLTVSNTNDVSSKIDIAKKQYEDWMSEYGDTITAYLAHRTDSTEYLIGDSLRRIGDYYYSAYNQLVALDKNLIETKKTLFSTYFDWEVEAKTNADGSYKLSEEGLIQYEKISWKQREDIMNQFVENAKTGANNISKYMGDYVTGSIISAWTRNRSQLNTILTGIETQITDLSNYMANNIGKNLTELFAPVANKYGKKTSSIPFLPDLVKSFEALSAEQDIVNKQASDFIKIWIGSGVKGKISDITSMMADFSKNLYTSMQSALDETEFIDRFNTIGESLSNSITTKLKQNLMDNSLKNTFVNLNDEITKIMTGQDTSISDVLSLRQQIEKATASMQRDADKVRNISDLLSMSNDIKYSNTNQQIEYTSGTTSQITNNYQNSITLDVSTLVTTSKEDRTAFANAFAGEILVAIEKKIGKIK